MEALRRLILDELARQNISFRDAADRSKGLVSYGTLHTIAKGRHTGGTISDRVLTGIALALDVPVRQVRDAYGIESVEPVGFELPDKSKYLTPKQRRAVLAMVDAFLDGNDAGKSSAK